MTVKISIHTLLAEGDRETKRLFIAGYNISIHTLLAEGDGNIIRLAAFQEISIHTLLAEGDWCENSITGAAAHFNPHPPCGG